MEHRNYHVVLKMRTESKDATLRMTDGHEQKTRATHTRVSSCLLVHLFLIFLFNQRVGSQVQGHNAAEHVFIKLQRREYHGDCIVITYRNEEFFYMQHVIKVVTSE